MAVSSVVSAPREAAALPAVPVGELLAWGALVVLLAVVLLYFVGAEQGATSMLSGNSVHEFVHDGRHLLGFPCH